MIKHKLGDTAFVTRENGSISRTIVISVGLGGQVGYLEHSFAPYHFLFKDALAASTAQLKAKERELEEALATIRHNIAAISAPEYEQAVLKSPLRRESDSVTGSMLEGEALDLPVPAGYFEPGTRIYGIVTPKTHNTMIPHYRPVAYFVLESTIKEVRLMRGGSASYRLDSNYHIDRLLFTDLKEAKQRLVRIFAEETRGSLPLEAVRLVSHQEEKEANEASTRETYKQVASQFEKLSSAGD